MTDEERMVRVQYIKCPNADHWILFDVATTVRSSVLCPGCVPKMFVQIDTSRLKLGFVGFTESDSGFTKTEPKKAS
jgi:hypothetical protein